MVFVVFFGVFTLTFYANVIFVDLEDEVREDKKDSAVKRRNGIEYILQIIFRLVQMSKSLPTHTCNLSLQNGPTSNVMFDEVTNTQALGDLTLSNKAGKTQVTGFKLDSGAGANLLRVGTYYKLFNKH